jgi:acyl carrier protein
MLKDEIRKFVEETVAAKRVVAIGDDDSLIEAGLLDSMALMRLMQFVESRSGVRVPPAAVTPMNFDSVSAIDRLVTSLRLSPPAQ